MPTDAFIHKRGSVCQAAVWLAMLFPTALTFVYFVLLAHSPAGWQQAVYVVGKASQFAFPVLAVVWCGASRASPIRSLLTAGAATLRPRRLRFGAQAGALGAGLGFGLLVSIAAWVLYHAVWKTNPEFADATAAIRDKIIALGVHGRGAYVGLGVFYALCHSGLEEYYWRWFVYGQLRARRRMVSALAISSLAFAAHHVIVLATYFGWLSPLTYALAIGVALGGVVWAWLYERSGSVAGSWLSHLIVDAAIFAIGYDLAHDALIGASS